MKKIKAVRTKKSEKIIIKEKTIQELKKLYDLDISINQKELKITLNEEVQLDYIESLVMTLKKPENFNIFTFTDYSSESFKSFVEDSIKYNKLCEVKYLKDFLENELIFKLFNLGWYNVDKSGVNKLTFNALNVDRFSINLSNNPTEFSFQEILKKIIINYKP